MTNPEDIDRQEDTDIEISERSDTDSPQHQEPINQQVQVVRKKFPDLGGWSPHRGFRRH